MIIPEFIGYCIETAAIALWRTRPMQACYKWLQVDQDRTDVYLFGGLGLVWLILCVAGLA